MPNVDAADGFWRGVGEFCRGKKISDLTVGSFGSAGGTIPDLGAVVERKRRWEYVLDLQSPDLFRKMRKGHAYSVKRGQKAGLELIQQQDAAACEAHARLINQSMGRRQERGEAVSADARAGVFKTIIDLGAGRLYQARLDGEVVSSNLILLAEKGGYNHTQGTSPEGMECGAAQFLVHGIAESLKAEGKTIFNLGGTDQPESGLAKFKTGFGKATQTIELQSAKFAMGSKLLRTAKNTLRALAAR
jgi:hypothetical protein